MYEVFKNKMIWIYVRSCIVYGKVLEEAMYKHMHVATLWMDN